MDFLLMETILFYHNLIIIVRNKLPLNNFVIAYDFSVCSNLNADTYRQVFVPHSESGRGNRIKKRNEKVRLQLLILLILLYQSQYVLYIFLYDFTMSLCIISKTFNILKGRIFCLKSLVKQTLNPKLSIALKKQMKYLQTIPIQNDMLMNLQQKLWLTNSICFCKNIT